ncbi:ABC transporter F family member 4 [Mugil cephalus]|uniref:ABC transporter F family member 4 n=1 Tax=Mugil cephalus TaxID=48193 RepID=UPI001FB7AA10|nr:ABC transporter F family member 4 [Mugil cephalus]
MRPTTSTMLQQNNNNNYPCLNVSGSTREMLQKCSRASLPFPSRLELGLGDLPLIRGLRAWALCSKNRRKAGSLLGAGQAPTAPPAGRGSSTSCPRPADVHLSGEWGRMGYGLPLGVDARQAGIGALVTVATLKTSEGSGKTQTQCLFLRTEKGSCLYSTAKPSPGVTTGAASGWLRGKTGGGDTPAGRRDNGPTPPAQAGANRVRVRSGRRWRKSSNAAGREKAGVSRERQQRSREDPVDERQEERDKGGLDCKQFPSPQRDGRTCCHNVSPKTCSQCGRRAQRRESQDENVGGESQGGGVPNRLYSEVKGMRKERRKNEEEEKTLAAPNSDLESNSSHGDSHSSCDVGEMRKGESKMKTSHSQDDGSGEDEDTHPDAVKGHDDSIHGSTHNDRKPGEEVASILNGFSDHVEGDQDGGEEKGGKIQSPAECCENSKSSVPAEGSICNAEDTQNHRGRYQQEEEASPGLIIEPQDENNTVNETEKFFFKNEEKLGSSSPLRDHRDLPISESDGEKGDGSRTVESEPESVEENHKEVKRNRAPDEDRRFQDSADGFGGWEDEDGSIAHVGSNRVTNINVSPPTSLTSSMANPAPSLPLLGSMATGLPCLEEGKGREEEEEEEEEEEVLVRAAAREGEGGQEEERRKQKELEKQGEEEEEEEEERDSTVATEEGRKEEEEEEEEDEFGVFMQAEGEPAWSEGFTMSASVPCGSGESDALGNHAVPRESTHCTPGWTDDSFHQSDDTWAAFPQDPPQDGGRDAVEQWWPSSAAEEGRGGLSTNHNLAAVFAEAFPSLPGSSSSDLHTVPTLTQVLRGRASQDQGLLDSFHDLNKMIGQRYKRANGVSRDLLLKTLHLEQPHTESRPAPWTANRRLSPGLPSANQNAAAKRRLSYDYNRNIVE